MRFHRIVGFCLVEIIAPVGCVALDTAISVKGNGMAFASGSGFNYTASGTATLTGFTSTASFSANGPIPPLQSGQFTGPITGNFTLDFSGGNTISGTLSIPGGILVPSFATQVVGAIGSLTVTGGTGMFAGTTGSFPSVTGSGMASSLTTSTFQFSGTGALNLAPASIKAVSGDGQSGPPGVALPNPAVAEVRDGSGATVAGVTVNFASTNATVNPVVAKTDSNGRASTQVTLGGAALTARVTATVGSLAPAVFNFTVTQPTTTLTIKKTWQAAAGGNPLRGDTFTYSILVANNGSAAANGVSVLDTPDPRTELALQGPLTFNLGILPPGASQNVTVNASASAVGVYANSATVSWSDLSGKSSTASATTSTEVDRQAADFAASAMAPVLLMTGVGQAVADGANVYVTNNPGDSLTILSCAGGTCAVTSTVALGDGAAPVAVTEMDVDGDGLNDILVLNQGAGTITALLSSNPGAPQVSTVGPGPVAFAPFRAPDGVPRLAVAFSGMIGVFAWIGQQFQLGATVAIGPSPVALVNADFNGDGSDDLAELDGASGMLQILLGDGMGGLILGGQQQVTTSRAASAASSVAIEASPRQAGTNSSAIAVGDVDNNGSLDLAVSTAGGLVVLLNDGMANFTPQPAVPTSGAGATVLADFDGDGNLDAAVANAGAASVSLYRGDGTGAFSPAGAYLTGRMPVSLAVSDLNGDGTPDLISADAGSMDLVVLLFSLI